MNRWEQESENYSKISEEVGTNPGLVELKGQLEEEAKEKQAGRT